jgi:hypothetical protein
MKPFRSYRAYTMCALWAILAALVLAACDSSGSQAAAPTAPPQAAAPTSVSLPTLPPQPAGVPPTAAPIIAPTPAVAPPPTSVPAAAPTTATASNGLTGEPRAALRNAFAKLSSAGPYRIKETSTFTLAGKTQTVEWVREFTPPGRLHILPDSQGRGETIIIDHVWYTKDQSGNWTKSDSPIDPGSKRPNVADILAKAISDVQLVGPEVLNGTPTMAYSMNFNAPDGKFMGTIKAWIGVTDGLPRQAELEGTQASEEAQIPIQVRDIYEYDPGIKIELPVP